MDKKSTADRKRTIHQLDTPFSGAQWPTVSLEDQETILELLCSLLNPLGQHRTKHVPVSKGKWARRRRRRLQKPTNGLGAVKVAPAMLVPLPTPELSAFVDVGLTCVTRELGMLAEQVRPDETGVPGRGPYAAVFVARTSHSTAFHSHLPQMVDSASRMLSSGQRARLVGFSRPCSDRLSKCLGIPRVSCIGLRISAPGAGALLSLLQAKVEPVEIAWLREAEAAEFRATNIKAIETTAGSKKQRR